MEGVMVVSVLSEDSFVIFIFKVSHMLMILETDVIFFSSNPLFHHTNFANKW